MHLTRYIHIRERLITLYRLIQDTQFSVWIAPKTLMDIDELKGRTQYTREDTLPDNDYYDTQQLRSMSVAHLCSILPNLVSERDIGYREPNTTIPLLYESVQEYILLWSEIIKNVPDLPYPNIQELKLLESYAYTLFNAYKEIKPYLDRREQEQLKGANADASKRGLASLMGLFKIERIGVRGEGNQMSFVSYVDELYTAMNWHSGNGPAPKAIRSSSDSLANTQNEAPTASMGSWYMNP